MTFEFRDAKRENVPLLILLAGGTASGKTESSLRLATGLAGGKPIALIDTERGRALHKADDYTFAHADLEEPFTPERYAEAIKAADDDGYAVIIVDSGSHEWEGIGGVLDMQDEEFKRMGERESARMTSWIEPKRRHKTLVRELNRTRAHVILNLRAEDKIEIVKVDGKTVVRPKESLVGAHGWIPICDKRLPFEATISLLFTADAPGVPKPVKLERRHQDLVPLDRQIDEAVGEALAAWAAGTSDRVPRNLSTDVELADEAERLTDALIVVGEERGTRQVAEDAIKQHRAKNTLADHVVWLRAQRDRALTVTEEVTS